MLTTKRLSLPEVGGDAVAYTGVGAGEIAEQLAVLMDDPGRRRELGSAALARAGQFTWAASAARHQEAYDGRRAVATAPA